MTGSVAVLVGRQPTEGSVLHDVLARLRAAGVDARLHLLDGAGPAPAAEVHLLKDLEPPVLQALAGTPGCVPAPEAVLRSLDKAAVVARLSACGVPVPATRLLTSWEDVRSAASAGPVVVKPQRGVQGAGVLLLDGDAPAAASHPGPWLAQDRVTGDGVDRKLYVVGDRVEGVLRRWPSPPGRPGTPFDAAGPLADLARAAAAALDLEVCGVDVLLGPDGPVVVDVNAVPGFKGVPGAAGLLAEHLLQRLATTGVAACA